MAIAAAFALPAFAQTAGEATGKLPPVTITAKPAAPAQEAAAINGVTDAPIATTPMSISVVRADALRDAGAGNLSEVLRADVSSSDFYNTTGFIENAQVRGFLLDNTLNYRRDGLPISNYTPFALENKDSVEILKGLSGVQAGTSAPGGLINTTIKRPTQHALREVFFGIAERGTVTAATDIGGQLADYRFGYRINAAAERRRPMADNAPGSRTFLSGAFDLRLSEATVLEAEFEAANSKQISVPGFGLLDKNGDGIAETLPAPISPRVNLNAQPWSQPFESRSTIFSVGIKQQLSADWRASVRALQQRIRTNDRIAFPDGCSNGPVYLYPGFCGNGDADVYDFRSENERRTLRALKADVRGNIATGSVKHELSFSFTQSNYAERFEPKQAYNYVGFTNIFAPVTLPADPSRNDINTQRDQRIRELAVTDAMRLPQGWSLWLGARRSSLDRGSERTDGSRAVAYSQSFTTPWAAIGYEPWQGGFVYASTGSGVESEVVPNRPDRFSNAGDVLPALRSRQQEIGFKQVLPDAGLFSAVLFNIKKPFSGDVNDGSGAPALRIAGAREARHRGLELSWAGALATGLEVQAQAAFLNARVVKSLDPAEQGKRTVNVAPANASLALAWTVPDVPNLIWTNRLAASGKKPVTADNSVQLPASWQWDSSVAWGHRWDEAAVTWRAGIDNVLNRRYWKDAPTQYWGGIYLFPAQPRTFRMSAQVRF